jgi:hypothetical protein
LLDPDATNRWRLHLVEFLTALLLRLTTTSSRAAGSAECTLRAAATPAASAPTWRRPSGPTTRATTTGNPATRAATAGRCTAPSGARPSWRAAELARALLWHHRRVWPGHSREPWAPSRTRRSAAGRRTRCPRTRAVRARTRRTGLAHSLRRGEGVVARTWSTRTPRSWSAGKPSCGTGTWPRRGSGRLGNPGGGRGLTGCPRYAWTWDRRWLRPSRGLSRRRSWCGWGGWGGRRRYYRRLGSHLHRGRSRCFRHCLGCLGRGRFLRCCLLNWGRLARQLFLEPSFDRRLHS